MSPALSEEWVRPCSSQMASVWGERVRLGLRLSNSLDRAAAWDPQICVPLCVFVCELAVALGFSVCGSAVCECNCNQAGSCGGPSWDRPPHPPPPRPNPCPPPASCL